VEQMSILIKYSKQRWKHQPATDLLLDKRQLTNAHIETLIALSSNKQLISLSRADNPAAIHTALAQLLPECASKIVLSQCITLASTYCCYLSSWPYKTYTSLSTIAALNFFNSTPPITLSVATIFSYSSLIINTIIAAYCLKYSIIEPLLRGITLDRTSFKIFSLVLLPSLCTSAPMAMLTYLDPTLSDAKKLSVALFSTILMFSFSAPGLYNLVSQTCYKHQDRRSTLLDKITQATGDPLLAQRMT
jgi:hypothetical protein